jgi:hypothetical protein
VPGWQALGTPPVTMGLFSLKVEVPLSVAILLRPDELKVQSLLVKVT